MRCTYGGTPMCKVHKWQKELEALRALLLQTNLREEIKWGVPCYTLNGKNVVILAAFKEFAALNFFKGSLIEDHENVLEAPGENSQASRFWKFTRADQVEQQAELILNYLNLAIELEASGQKVHFNHTAMPWPDELVEAFEDQPILKEAFLGLSPGRQRGYLIFFNKAKQAVTRKRLIQQKTPLILQGKGLQDK